MRILLALDGSPSADRARALVTSLAWGPGTTVRLVAALDVAPALWGGPWIPAIPVDADELEEEAVVELTRVLQEARPAMEAAGLHVEAELLRGRPSAAIVDDARIWEPDLIVVGSRGHGPVETAVLGSVSAAIVDHAACPVLVARGDHAARVILAEDGSPAGMAARDVVASWPALAAIPVLVVGVVDVAAPWRSGIAPTMFGAAMDVYTDMITSARTTHREIVAATEAHLRAAGRSVGGELREGHPADQLRQAATDPAGDLIVVGSRGYVGITRLVMGSVAHAVLTHAHCSVLVVKQPHESHQD
jgi:nucleotide-binding universal stress UspA family protein